MRILNFAGNRIKIIPSTIVDITELEHLNLADNQIETIPEDLLLSLASRAISINLKGNPLNPGEKELCAKLNFTVRSIFSSEKQDRSV